MWYNFKTCKFKTAAAPTKIPATTVPPVPSNSNQFQGTNNNNNFKQDTLYQTEVLTSQNGMFNARLTEGGS